MTTAIAAAATSAALPLTQEWDKTFPKSDKVEHCKATFKNRFGITLAADVYKPKTGNGELGTYPPSEASRQRRCPSRGGNGERDVGRPVSNASAVDDQSPTSRLSKKELRQQRAAERAKIAPKLRELKKRVETAEKKIDELQKALDEASAELFNPKPDTDFAEANRKVRTLQFEIDRYTADWEEAATELEALEAEKPQ